MIKSINSKVLNNILWLFFDKIIRMGIGVFVLILLARYLGPEQYGLLNYAQALIALFAALSGLGLYGIVVRDLVKYDDKNLLLGTAFGLKILSAIFAYALLVLLIYILRPDDELSKYIVIILGLSLLFNTSDIIKFWFEANVQSKYTVIVENSVFVVISILKLLMIYYKFSLLSFVYIFTLEAFLVALFLFIIYIKQSTLSKWKFNKTRAKELLKDSWPLIISSIAWIIYTRIDQIMIGQMLGDKEVGLYSAAIRLSDIANFIPTMIAFSIIPTIIKLRDENRKLYEKKFQDIYYVVISLMIILAIFVSFFSNEIIHILYGNDYIKSANVLQIHFWIIIFVALATISGKYLINDSLQKITMNRHIIGILLNIPLNYFMIPLYGIEGAAIASLISLVVTNYLFDLFTKKTRLIFFHKTKALVFFWILDLSIIKYKEKYE